MKLLGHGQRRSSDLSVSASIGRQGDPIDTQDSICKYILVHMYSVAVKEVTEALRQLPPWFAHPSASLPTGFPHRLSGQPSRQHSHRPPERRRWLADSGQSSWPAPVE